MNFKKRLYILSFLIVAIIIVGSIGYYIILDGKPRFGDCVFMTVISLTSVGYGEVVQVTGNLTAEIFTMILITFGMGVILYGISAVTAMILEGELSGILRKKRMDKLIQKLEKHYIVCGGGETGLHIIEELVENNESVVLIDSDEDRIQRCKDNSKILYIKGDATDDQNLIAAGIEFAEGIIIALPSDKDSLYVTMTAKMLNNKIRIISRMTDKKLKPKLKKAGADRVVSPNMIGALRMASEMIRPTAVDFLDKMLRSKQGNLRIHEIVFAGVKNIEGKTISDLSLNEKYKLLVLGAKYNGEDIEFNPKPEKKISQDTKLIIMGKIEDIEHAKKQLTQ